MEELGVGYSWTEFLKGFGTPRFFGIGVVLGQLGEIWRGLGKLGPLGDKVGKGGKKVLGKN